MLQQLLQWRLVRQRAIREEITRLERVASDGGEAEDPPETPPVQVEGSGGAGSYEYT